MSIEAVSSVVDEADTHAAPNCDRESEALRQFAVCEATEPFDVLVGRYTPLVYSTCRRLLRRDDLAKDATQSVFIALSRKARDIRKGVILAGWLYHMARWAALSLLREERRRAWREACAWGLTLPSEPVAAEGESHAADVHQLVETLVGKLPELYRAPVVLHYLQGKPFAEIGQHLQCDEAAARQRCWRALGLLRKGWRRHELADAGVLR